VPKFEVAAEFTTLERDGLGQQRTEPGVGGRFTFNFNRNIAVESAGYFFPRKCFICANAGNMGQVVAGAKIGKRFEKWGIFGKARPGFVTFSQGALNGVLLVPPGTIQVETNRTTNFATDFGAVLEFYPSPKIVTRFDLGDTIIHFKRRTVNAIVFDPITQQPILFPFTRPARTTHNFQFIAGVGFRF
jgi:hypothetical protein